MAHLGGTEGSGLLLSAGTELGPVTYRLDVYQRNGLKDGRGTLQGDMTVLANAFQVSDSTLRLADGRETRIVINRMDAAGASFLTSGPIPGY